MTKIKLEIETDSEKELVSATINFKYSNGKVEINDVVTNTADEQNKKTTKSSKKGREKVNNSPANDIYSDLKNLPPPEEGVDESFMEKY